SVILSNQTKLISFTFNHPPPTQIYTLSLHDALPISRAGRGHRPDPRHEARQVPRGEREGSGRQADRRGPAAHRRGVPEGRDRRRDRKSTRLNSSHRTISYAVFCLKKKK